jgi:hypothetical protein
MFFLHRCPSNPRGDYRRADPQSEQIIVRQPSTFTTSVATNLDASSTTASINPLSFIIRLAVCFLADRLGYDVVLHIRATRASGSTPDSLNPVPDDDHQIQRHPIRIYNCDLAECLVTDGLTRAYVYCCRSRLSFCRERTRGLGIDASIGRWTAFWNWEVRLYRYKMQALCSPRIM